MGRAIALFFAYAGHDTVLVDSEPRPPAQFDALSASVREDQRAELEFLQRIGQVDDAQAEAIGRRLRILARDAAGASLARADFVVEAVAEVREIKQSTYAWLSDKVGAHTILASTTSTMSADELAGFVGDPGRFLNAHWLNPAHLMPLVEVSPAGATRDETVAATRGLLERIGKVPIVCRASPGYVVSRIQALALNEAARMVEEGIAPAEEIDKAVRVGFGVRYATLGLLEFIDWGGGDILYYASNYLAANIDAQRFAPPEIVRRNMAANRNGLRDGVGFYDWRDRDVPAYRQERLAAFVRLLQHLELMPPAAPA